MSQDPEDAVSTSLATRKTLITWFRAEVGKSRENRDVSLDPEDAVSTSLVTGKTLITWFLAEVGNCAPGELKIPRTSGRAEFPSGIVGGVGEAGWGLGKHVVSTCFLRLLHTYSATSGRVHDRPRVMALRRHGRPWQNMDGDASALPLLSLYVVC